MLSVSLAACSALAGCGAGKTPPSPSLARGDAAPLVTIARRIAGEGACAQRRDIGLLRRRATLLVTAHRVPPALAGQLTRGVDALVADTPLCVTAVPAAKTPPPPPPRKHGEGHKPHPHHGHRDGGGDGGGD